jgi:hypothetical protein
VCVWGGGGGGRGGEGGWWGGGGRHQAMSAAAVKEHNLVYIQTRPHVPKCTPSPEKACWRTLYAP